MRSPFMLQAAVLALGVSAMAAPGSAQAPVRYHPSPDTLHYETSSPFTLYWVRGDDTIGVRREDRGIESHHWSGTDDEPVLTIRQLLLNATRTQSVDTVSVTPDGRIPPELNRSGVARRVDLLLRLPPTPLDSGVRWADTVRAGDSDGRGPQSYEARRSYHVERLLDTLGRRVADVRAEGDVRLRITFAPDSQGKVSWIEVEGPVRERYLFDVGDAVLLRREWSMELAGRGVPPDATDTLPAGLASTRTLRLAEPEHARFLLAPLPPGDTSVTVLADGGEPLVVQTVSHAPGRTTVGLTRNDGTVAVGTATMGANGIASYEATWSHGEVGLVRQRITRQGDTLRITSDAAPDTTLVIPTEHWAVADRAMPALLAPQLLAIPRDGSPRAIAILRPSALRWDRGTVAAHLGAGTVVISLHLDGEPSPEFMLLTPEGQYLYAEFGGPVRLRLLPTSELQRARLREVLALINGR